MQVVDLAKLSEVLSQLLLEFLHVLVDRETTEVKVVAGHRALESQRFQAQEVLSELSLHVRRHVQVVHIFVLGRLSLVLIKRLLLASACQGWSLVSLRFFLRRHELEQRLPCIRRVFEAHVPVALVLLLGLGLLLQGLFADYFAADDLSKVSEDFLFELAIGDLP